jgi:hypothetical protein
VVLFDITLAQVVSSVKNSSASSFYLSRHMPAFLSRQQPYAGSHLGILLLVYVGSSIPIDMTFFLYLGRHILCSNYILFLYAGSHTSLSRRSLWSSAVSASPFDSSEQAAEPATSDGKRAERHRPGGEHGATGQRRSRLWAARGSHGRKQERREGRGRERSLGRLARVAIMPARRYAGSAVRRYGDCREQETRAILWHGAGE